MSRVRAYRLVAGLCLVAVAAQPVGARIASAARSASTVGTAILADQIPTIVRGGQATLLRSHAAADTLSINLSLPLRDQAGLDAFIAQQASHGVYLSQDQFNAAYAPTARQVQDVEQWAAAHSLQPSFISGDNTLITLRGATGAVDAALNVSISDYRGPGGEQFYSASQDATLPAALGVQAVSGLSDLRHWHPLHRVAARAVLSRALNRAGGYLPSDYRAAYDVAGHGYDGTAQTIGFTLWGTSVPDSDLASFAANTGDVRMSAGTGPDQNQWLPVNGGSTATDALVETALDVQSAHGIATHAHLKYWLGDESCSGGQCGGTDVGLEGASPPRPRTAPSMSSATAAGGEAASASDPFISATTASFQHAVAVGTTFYFSSGDTGSNSGGTGLAISLHLRSTFSNARSAARRTDVPLSASSLTRSGTARRASAEPNHRGSILCRASSAVVRVASSADASNRTNLGMAALAIGPIQSAPSVGTLAPPCLLPPGPSIDAGPDSRGFQAISPKANTTRRGWMSIAGCPIRDRRDQLGQSSAGRVRLAPRGIDLAERLGHAPADGIVPKRESLDQIGNGLPRGDRSSRCHGSRLAGFQPLIGHRLDQVGKRCHPALAQPRGYGVGPRPFLFRTRPQPLQRLDRLVPGIA